MKNGIEAGRRPELTGGGLIRSLGGWKLAKTILKGRARVKGDERIFGDSDFADNVLARCHENPNVAKAGGLQSQGVKDDDVIGYCDPLTMRVVDPVEDGDLKSSSFPER